MKGPGSPGTAFLLWGSTLGRPSACHVNSKAGLARSSAGYSPVSSLVLLCSAQAGNGKLGRDAGDALLTRRRWCALMCVGEESVWKRVCMCGVFVCMPAHSPSERTACGEV